MLSDHVRFWHDAERIQVPTRPWSWCRDRQCGSPPRDQGGVARCHPWSRSHAAVRTRRHLLDIDDPSRVIGHLRDPILIPNEQERDGYVPNVVYSCGSIIHNNRLVIAYGASDTSTTFATVPVDTLLSELT